MPRAAKQPPSVPNETLAGAGVPVSSRQQPGEVGVRGRRQAGIGQDLLERDRGLGGGGAQARQHPRPANVSHRRDEPHRVLARQGAELELEAAAVAG